MSFHPPLRSPATGLGKVSRIASTIWMGLQVRQDSCVCTDFLVQIVGWDHVTTVL